jgi:hypothetical protein
MQWTTLCHALRWLVPLVITLSPCHPVTLSSASADTFDHYLNPILGKVPSSDNVQAVKELTPTVIADHQRVLPDSTGAFLVVTTNEGRRSKLLVQAARQKLGTGEHVPILLIERFVTYKEGTEQTVQASGKNVSLFPGFHFSLDLGQVVPEALGGDLDFVVEGGKAYTKPAGKARMYLVTNPLPEAAPKKSPKLVVGDSFEPRYFNGTYHLYDDGRRSGKLVLKVEEGGEISGAYYSDKDGEKYDVKGKLGMPVNTVQFTIKFPRSEQTFQGWLFTGNAQALTGYSRLLEHEQGFYALRVEE